MSKITYHVQKLDRAGQWVDVTYRCGSLTKEEALRKAEFLHRWTETNPHPDYPDLDYRAVERKCVEVILWNHEVNDA